MRTNKAILAYTYLLKRFGFKYVTMRELYIAQFQTPEIKEPTYSYSIFSGNVTHAKLSKTVRNGRTYYYIPNANTGFLRQYQLANRVPSMRYY